MGLLVHFGQEGSILFELLELVLAAPHLVDTLAGEQPGQLVNVLEFVLGVEQGLT